jgi:uncharacterized membrane protein YgcG
MHAQALVAPLVRLTSMYESATIAGEAVATSVKPDVFVSAAGLTLAARKWLASVEACMRSARELDDAAVRRVVGVRTATYQGRGGIKEGWTEGCGGGGGGGGGQGRIGGGGAGGPHLLEAQLPAQHSAQHVLQHLVVRRGQQL